MADQTFPPNPYVINGPSRAASFFGRDNILNFIHSTVGNTIVLYGQRRIGKTSLLQQAASLEPNAVYFNIHRYDAYPLKESLFALALTIAETLDYYRPLPTDFDDTGTYFTTTFLPAIHAQSERLLLLFDESSPDIPVDDNKLLAVLQTLSYSRLTCVFTGGLSPDGLADDSALHKRIDPLSPAETEMLILKPTQGVLNFEPAATQAIIDLTGGHPYFTQLICSELYTAMTTRQQPFVTVADVISIIPQALETGQAGLEWFWSALPRTEQLITTAMAEVIEFGLEAMTLAHIQDRLSRYDLNIDEMHFKRSLIQLEDWGIITTTDDDTFRLTADLLHHWLATEHPLRLAADHTAAITPAYYHDESMTYDLDTAYTDSAEPVAINPPAEPTSELPAVAVLLAEGHAALERDGLVAAHPHYEAALAASQDTWDEIRTHLVEYAACCQETHNFEAARQAVTQLYHWQLIPHSQLTQRLAQIWLAQGHASHGLTATTAYREALNLTSYAEHITTAIKTHLDGYAQDAIAEHNYPRAIQAIQQLETLLPSQDPWVNERLADIWLQQGRYLMQQEGLQAAAQPYEQALEQLQSLLPANEAELSRRLAAVWLARGHYQLATENFHAALDTYRKALDCDRRATVIDSIQAQLETYLQQSGTDADLATLQTLLPERAEIFNQRLAEVTLNEAQQRLHAGEVDAAFDAYQTVLRLDSRPATITHVCLTLDDYLQRLTSHTQTLEIMRRVRALLPDADAVNRLESEVWSRRGAALAEAGDPEAALEAYQHGLELDPTNETLITRLDNLEVSWRQLPEVERTFDAARTAHEAQHWAEAIDGWLRLLKMSIMAYRGHDIAQRLAEARDGQRQQDQRLATMFESAWTAHQAQNWTVAALNWQQLLDLGVTTYRDKDIAALLAEAHQDTILSVTPDLEMPPALQATPEPTQSTRSVWTVVFVVMLLTGLFLCVGGAIFGFYTVDRFNLLAHAAQPTATTSSPIATETQAAQATATANHINAQAQATATAEIGILLTAESEATAAALPTNTPTPTATPTETPLPTATPTASPTLEPRSLVPVLLRETFDTAAGGWPTGLTLNDLGQRTAAIDNGRYQLALESTEDVVWPVSIPEISAQDFWLEFEATVVDSSTRQGGISLIFRQADDGTRYWLHFDRTGDTYVKQWQNDDWTVLAHLPDTNAFDLSTGVTNHFSIVVDGTNLTLYANDAKLNTDVALNQNPGSPIGLGLHLHQANQNLVVNFDNLVVRNVP